MSPDLLTFGTKDGATCWHKMMAMVHLQIQTTARTSSLHPTCVLLSVIAKFTICPQHNSLTQDQP